MCKTMESKNENEGLDTVLAKSSGDTMGVNKKQMTIRSLTASMHWLPTPHFRYQLL